MSGADYVCFTGPSELSAQQWSDWDVRLAWPVSRCAVRASRFHKLQPHRVLPGYDWWIWVDACADGIGDLSAALQSAITVLRHSERDCPYAELDVCVAQQRVTQADAECQAAAYTARGLPQRAGLFATTMLGRWNTGAVVAFNDAWWREVSLFTSRDQVSLPIVCRDQNIVPAALDGTPERNPYFRWRRTIRDAPQFNEAGTDDSALRRIAGCQAWAAHVDYEERLLSQLPNTPEYTADWTAQYARHLAVLQHERPGFAPHDYLEVGVYEGRSVHVACGTFSTIARCTAVDPWPDPAWRQRAERNLALLAPRVAIEMVPQVSRTALPALEHAGRTFDMIYIDGAHTADAVYADSCSAYRLLRPGGLLVWDDLPWECPISKLRGQVEVGLRRFLEQEKLTFEPARYTGWQYSLWKP